MKIVEIKIRNFRNIIFLNLSNINNFNVIIGNNAHGKSNLIESLFYVGSLKSFRCFEESELINFDSKVAKIDAIFTKKEANNSVKIILDRENNKSISINEKKVTKISDYIGKFNITLFSPDDLSIIKGDSSHRRKFIDSIFSQIDKQYLRLLIGYHKILKHRNQLLKMIKMNIEKEINLDPWDEQIIKYSSIIYKIRREKTEKLNKLAHNIHNRLKNEEFLDILYKDTIYCGSVESQDDYEKSFKTKLKRVRTEEISRGTSLLGPHRDDLEITINNLNTRVFGSQGQKRSVAISLRMAEAEIINNEFNEYPILLLDDIFSELDEKRKKDLLTLIENKSQVFITGTHSNDFGLLLNKADVFHVEKGVITRAYAH